MNETQEESSINLVLGVTFLLAGIVLLVYGFKGSESVLSEITKAVTGAPANRTLWLLIGGMVCSVVGAMSLFGRRGGSV